MDAAIAVIMNPLLALYTKFQGSSCLTHVGTEGGALVAAFATAGYSGAELLQLMKGGGALSPRTLLDDGGNQVRRLKQEIERAKTIWATRRGLRKWWALYSLVKANMDTLTAILKTGGLYKGDRLQESLFKRLSEKLNLPGTDRKDISFSDLPDGRPLKIVASDLSKKRAAVFSLSDRRYGTSVVVAARASAGYPFVFQPVLAEGSLLSDGGLASNLPAFLFSDESQRTRHPILAFDLVGDDEVVGASAFDLLPAILDTALEAGDHLLARETAAHRVPVRTPGGIDTLTFDLTDEQIQSLFDAGYSAAQKFLMSFRPFEISRDAGDGVVKGLQALYAPPRLIEPVLRAVCDYVASCTPAKELRGSIMLPTGRPNGSRIVVYTWGFRREDPDIDLELGHLTGCTGKAIEDVGLSLADLEKAQKNPEIWHMNWSEQAKVAKDRKAMVSIPILSRPVTPKDLPTRDDVLGTLSVDSSTRFEETGWFTLGSSAGSLEPDAKVVKGLIEWAGVLTFLLRAEHDGEDGRPQ